MLSWRDAVCVAVGGNALHVMAWMTAISLSIRTYEVTYQLFGIGAVVLFCCATLVVASATVPT